MGKISFQLLQSNNAQEEPIPASSSELFSNFHIRCITQQILFWAFGESHVFVTVIKYTNKINLRMKELILVHSSRLYSVMVGKAQQQALGVSGHTVSTVKFRELTLLALILFRHCIHSAILIQRTVLLTHL